MGDFSSVPLKGRIIYFGLLIIGFSIIGVNIPYVTLSPSLLLMVIASIATSFVNLPISYGSQDLGGPLIIGCVLSGSFSFPELVVIAFAHDTHSLFRKRPFRGLRFMANCAESVTSLLIAWLVWNHISNYSNELIRFDLISALITTFCYILSNLAIMNVLIKYFYPRPPVRLVDNFKSIFSLTFSTRSFEYIFGILCAIIYRELGGTSLIEILVLFFIVGFIGRNSAKNLVQKITLHERLNHSELYLRDLVEGMELGLVALDSNNRIMHFNTAAESILHTKLIVEQPVDKNGEFHSLLGLEPNNTVEVKIRDRLIHIRRTPIHVSNNRIGGNIFLLEDITEAKVFEDYAMHKDRLTLLGQFSAGIMHEMSKPLTMLSLAYEEISSSAADISSKYLNIFGRSIDDLTDLSQQLLNFSSPRPGRGKTFSNLGQVFSETLEIAGALAKKKQITFLFEEGCDLFIDIDEHELRQVFLNLISNAIDVTPRCGSIRCEVGLGAFHAKTSPIWQKDCLEGRTIRGWFSVEDQGAGFTEQVIARLGDSFVTTKGEGHGLGLSIVLLLLKRWNARMQIFHLSSGGSRVVIEL